MESKGKSTSGLELTIAVPGSSSASSGHEGGSCNMRDIDINQPAPSAEEELIPVITIDDREELDVHQNQSRPKKLRLSLEQSRVLEESFRQNHTLNSRQKEALAANLKLRPRQVEVWFQNRRARTKLKQTQMECAYLKRCFGSLTEENRRLQREVEELRGLGAAPPSVVLSPQARRPAPAATASTVCPRCQRLATIASSSVSNMDLITAFQPQQPSGSC